MLRRGIPTKERITSTSVLDLDLRAIREIAPLFAAVESDVVGYAKVPVENIGYDIVAVPFATLSDGVVDGVFPIQEIEGTLSQNNRETFADKLMTLNPVTKQYTTYIYKSVGWVKEGETEATKDVVSPGMGLFFSKARQAGEIVVSGKVDDAETVSIPLEVGFNLVSNPYPAAIKIADLQGELSANDRLSFADSIMVLDPVTKRYSTYYLKKAGWIKEGETDPTEDVINACQGFYFTKVRTAGTVEFKRPY